MPKLYDSLFARRGCGIIVLRTGETPLILEFNEFLKRIARNHIRPDDQVVSSVFTDGRLRLVGDLRVYEMVKSGMLETSDLPIRTPNGVITSDESPGLYIAAVRQNFRHGVDESDVYRDRG